MHTTKCIKNAGVRLTILMLIVLLTSCKKLVDVDGPATSINSENAYASDATTAAILTGLYTQISAAGSNIGSVSSLSIMTALSADELTLYNGVSNTIQVAYYKNSLSILKGGYEFWNNIYPQIFICNSVIERLNSPNDLTPRVKQQLLGEAKFMRAFFYFYLVNLYGDVPLVLTTDYTLNATLARSPKDQVLLQIISDLKEAQSLLSVSYLKADVQSITNERVRPTKWAATAFLARVYLYNRDWPNAEAQATTVIGNSALFGLNNLGDVFKKNSTEAIWQIQPVNTGWNTEDARVFILSVAPTGLNSTHPVHVSSFLLGAFESSDNRKTNWIDSFTDATGTFYYANKYKIGTQSSSVTTPAALSEYLMVLRLAEQYLIRAEARAKQNNLQGAIADIDIIRQRAGLPLISATNPAITQSALFDSIIHERQVELFTEWGHRWLDLKRTNAIDNIMASICLQKGGTWSPNWALYPLPASELEKDPNLVQNPGY